MVSETSFCYSYTWKNIKVPATTPKTFQQPHLQGGYQHLEESPGDSSGGILNFQEPDGCGEEVGEEVGPHGFSKVLEVGTKSGHVLHNFQIQLQSPGQGTFSSFMDSLKNDCIPDILVVTGEIVWKPNK